MAGMSLYLTLILAPLIAAIIAGFFGFILSKKIVHSLTILAILISTLAAYVVFYQVEVNQLYYDGPLYDWLSVLNQKFALGLLIDHLTATMLVIVTTISLMVHIYTVGYMRDEEGYARFFSYTALFTFMMIMLVIANNFIQLFFGWEGVGLVSYLLIGFYFKRSSANFASLKAFLINRLGDIGFILGIGLVLAYCGSLQYSVVFASLSDLTNLTLPGTNWSIITVICILLFIGAMGKSAQFPLHVWLPDSMEGPTPISALIHAATMVTAGIFMVARFSPLFNLSTTALTLIIICGGINCFFLGILGIIQTDIKRVIAYSTLSQLGYMTVALGCGAYSIGVFHLMTHAFFKALLFLAAGSVIIALHHEQDMRKMGGLAKYMPITYITMLIGALALTGIPPFAGFFSKHMILDAARTAYASGLPGAAFAIFVTYASMFITAVYTFRMIFMTFHGTERFRHGHAVGLPAMTPKESPLVVLIPLVLLAIPSVIIGWMGFNAFVTNTILSGSVVNAIWYVNNLQNSLLPPLRMLLEGFTTLPLYIGLLGILVAWIFHRRPQLSTKLIKALGPIYRILERNYFMDDLYINFFVPLGRSFGRFMWSIGDMLVIDGLVVNGAAKIVAWYSRLLKQVQTGYVNSYATFMVLGIILLLTFCTKLIFS